MKTQVQGIELHYTDKGKGAPLLFVHGFPLSRGAWQAQIDEFSASYRVIAPDLRGHGESGVKPGIVTMEDYARDLFELIKHLQLGPVILAGHSMGGYIALSFARLFPEKLKGLVLVATRAVADSPEAAAARRATAEKVKTEGPNFVLDSMTAKMLAPANKDSAMLSQVRALMASSQADGVIAALLGMSQRSDSTPLLSTLSIPTLVITGAEDVLIPASESGAMSKLIPGSKLTVIPNAGHLVAYEKPEEFNQALSGWLAEI